MVTYAHLRDVDPAAWAAIASVVRVWGEAVAARADELAELIAHLGSVWLGAAASAAMIRLTSLRATLQAAYPGLVGTDQALSEFGTALAAAQHALDDAAAPRPGSIVVVDPDGVARLAPRYAAPDPGDRADLLATSQALAAALAAADDADHEVAARLSAIVFDPLTAIPVLNLPPAGTDPVAIAAWWAGLNGEQQRYLVINQPSELDALNGVPVDARDLAGRIVLHQALVDGRWADDQLADGVSPTLVGVEHLGDRLRDPGRDRAYLLDLNATNGRATVAIGDPDRAANVLTMVPGVSSGLPQIASTLSTIDNIHDASGASTIGWVEYDAPGTIQSAMSATPARDAAPALSQFDQGLRVTHIGPAAHDSILGYSYGATVVGAASQVKPLADNEVIFVAAPGVGVDRASRLGVDPSHVWATVAAADPIRIAAKPLRIIGNLLLGRTPSTLWFGPSPTSAQFGGRVFASDSGSWLHPIDAHLNYFTPGSRSLAAIAAIAQSGTNR